jgi:hypothetical protein
VTQSATALLLHAAAADVLTALRGREVREKNLGRFGTTFSPPRGAERAMFRSMHFLFFFFCRLIEVAMDFRRPAAVLAIAIGFAVRSSLATEPVTELQDAVSAGEFSVAKRLAEGAQTRQQRDRQLATVAGRQFSAGEPLAAAATLRNIETQEAREVVLAQAGAPMLCCGGPFQSQNAAEGGATSIAGGGAFADFDSLMNLIQTTVVPDTWEALGGNSTIAPYPQGVLVDPGGTLKPIDSEPLAESRDEVVAVLASMSPQRRTWRAPTPLRCVSLRRLRDQITSLRLTGKPLTGAMEHFAGLSKIQYVIFSENDILLAAPVGGITSNRGWFVDRISGQATLKSEFLIRCLAASLADQSFGCTIDPTPQGMRAAMGVASSIQQKAVPIGTAADALRDALGMQRIEVFGTAGDDAIGLLMVESDRHMKRLALNEQPMPDGVDNYLDIVEQMIEQGPPNGLLLRLWFTSNPLALRANADRTVFELGDGAIRLSGENQRALADGGRGGVMVDPRSQRFVDQFNRHFAAIRQRYPIYGSLESLYQMSAVAELIDRHVDRPALQELVKSLAAEDDRSDWLIHQPRQVESIATMHSIRRGNQRHHVVLASGGVLVDPRRSLDDETTEYPSLDSTGQIANRRPKPVDHWWWDVR